MVVERFVLRPLVGRPVFVTIIVTLFIGAILRVAIILIFGNDTLPILTPWEPLGTVQVGSAMLDYSSIASLVAGLLAFGAFGYLLQKTRFGIQMRATSSDQEAALGVGIPVGKILAITWFLAGAMAALAGVFLGIRDYSVDLNLGYIALRAFPAVIVGGLDSVLGAIVAGLLLGTLEVMTAGYVNALLGPWGKNLHTVMPYLAMIVVLMVRPQGLFGSEKSGASIMPTSPLKTNYRDDLSLFRDRWEYLGLSLAIVTILAFPFLANDHWLSLGVDVWIMIVGAVSMMVLTGFAGQVSLGHAAFLAIGAYATAICSLSFGLPFWLALPIGMILCTIVGIVTGPFALRLEGST